jgi:hypothetical protein
MNTPALPEHALEVGGDFTDGKCACCGRFTRRITGFISAQGNAHAAYVACWTEGHRELGASMVVAIGGWSGAPLEERKAVALEWQVIPSGPGCAVVDGPASRWAAYPALGQLLTRAEVMNSRVAEEAFRIADVVFEQDPRFHAFWHSEIQ